MVIEVDTWNGTANDVQRFVNFTGASFPVLQLGGFLQTQNYYDMPYDNYVVIDADGIVRYTSRELSHVGSIGRFSDQALRTVIQAWLPSPVESHSWSTVKGLYR